MAFSYLICIFFRFQGMLIKGWMKISESIKAVVGIGDGLLIAAGLDAQAVFTTSQRVGLMKSQIYFLLIAGTLVFLANSLLASDVAAAPRFETIFTVTNTDDNGPGSLRDMILAANASPGPDIILIQIDGTDFLSSPLPVVTEDLAIDGTQHEFIIDGSSQYRIFEVPAGVILQLNGLELDSGYGGLSGGAVWNEGTLEIRDCFLLANFAELGGAIYDLGHADVSAGTIISQSNADQGAGIYNLGEFIVIDTTFSGNGAPLEGGAIYNAGTMTITAGDFYANYASDGAGIYSPGGELILQDTTFTANTADRNGGAIRTSSILEIQGGTYSENHALHGGALYLDAGAVTVIDRATFDLNTGEVGGAIFNEGQLVIGEGSLAGNHAEGMGGAIHNESSLEIHNSNLSQNTATGDGGGLHNNENGTVTLTAVNLEDNEARAGGALFNGGQFDGSGIIFATNHAEWGGAIQNTGNMNLADSQLDNNESKSEGGALYNTSRLNLSAVNFTANTGTDGGALLNRGDVEMTAGRMERNHAHFDFGGAIYNQLGSLRITDTIFTGNTVPNGGGAIFNYGELEITGSNFSGNGAKWGGAIYNRSNQPALIRGVTFENNYAGHRGGAILNDRSLELENCIFVDNHSEDSSGALHNSSNLIVRTSEFTGNSVGNGSGGAVENWGTGVITESIFQNNSASMSGGGISSNGPSANLTLIGVTLTQNQAVDGGALYNTGEMHVSTATISENRTSHFGGGIYNTGSMDVADSQFLHNGGINQPITDQGGAIYNAQNASVTINGVLFEENFAWFNGGAIASYGPLAASLAQFINNGSLDMGGAIFQIGGTATIQDTTFRGNNTWNYAGTIYTNSEMEIQRSLITNSDSWTGGAILSGGQLRIENSTISNNLAFFEGGAIQNYGTTIIAYSTLFGNSLSDDPASGAIQNYGSIEMVNSIIAGTDYGVNCAGAVTQSGLNLSDDGSCTGFLIADPLLGALQDNGGPTLTHALQRGSPALDAAAGEVCPPVDQRSITRPAGLACDLGAYEAAQTHINIDIRPKSTQNAINLGNIGTIPVAVLSEPGFSAPAMVDLASLLFGASGWENPPLVSSVHGKPLCTASDVNGDGLLDLVCTFALAGTNFTCDSKLGILRGLQRDGTWIAGSDLVLTLPCP